MDQEKLKEGVLCELKMGRWDAKVRLPKEQLGRSVPKDIIRAVQDVIDDKSLLKELSAIRRSAKFILKNNSLPFPIDSVFWIPKDKIELVNEKLEEAKINNEEVIKRLLQNFGKLKSDFKEKYPDFYNEDKYPSVDQLKEKYYFFWHFFTLNLPDKEGGILSPALYKKEKEKFNGLIKEMETMTITLIGNQLLKRVEALSEQCEAGKVNARTVTSLNRFFKRWDELWAGTINESKVKEIIFTLKKTMKTVSPERLQNNEHLQGKIQEKLENAMVNLKKIPNVKLKRKLDI